MPSLQRTSPQTVSAAAVSTTTTTSVARIQAGTAEQVSTTTTIESKNGADYLAADGIDWDYLVRNEHDAVLQHLKERMEAQHKEDISKRAQRHMKQLEAVNDRLRSMYRYI